MISKKMFRQRLADAWSKDIKRYPNYEFVDWLIDILYLFFIVRKTKRTPDQPLAVGGQASMFDLEDLHDVSSFGTSGG